VASAFLLAVLSQIVGDLTEGKIEKVVQKRNLEKSIKTAVDKAYQQFELVISQEDPEMLQVFGDIDNFWSLPEAKGLLSELVLHPFNDPTEKINNLRNLIAQVIVADEKNIRRIESALSIYLRLLGNEILYIPQLQDLYALFFEKINVETNRRIAESNEIIAQGMALLREDVNKIPGLSPSHQTQSPYLLAEPDLFPKHNLPTRPYYQFVGRQTELEKLISLMLPYPKSRYFIVTIDGIGGVGKTALALEAATYYYENYQTIEETERFGAVIWLSAKREILTPSGIHQRNSTFTTLSDLAFEIATVLGKSHILQHKLPQQKILITQELTTIRTLLVIDNFETIDDDELLAFLNDLPDPTKVIITTRHRIGYAFPLRLQGLSQKETFSLALNEAKAKGVKLDAEFIKKLYDLTGGIPLAIVWAIGLLNLGYSPKLIYSKFRTSESILKFCFQKSTGLLDKGSFRLLMSLAIFSKSVNREMLGRIAGLTQEDRDIGIAVLLQLSLVNREENRFSILPLTRNFAIKVLEQDSALNSELRGNWIRELQKLAKPFNKIGWRWHLMDELRQEGQHLVDLAEWSEENSKPDILLSIALALNFYFDITGKWSDRKSIVELGLEYAVLLNDQKLHFMLIRELAGGVLGQLGNLDEAISLISIAIKIAKDENEPEWKCKALLTYSNLLRRKTKYSEAQYFCDKAMDILPLLSNTIRIEAKASIHYEQGKISRDKSDWKAAQKNFILARKTFWEYAYETGEFEMGYVWGVLNNLGYVTYKLGDYSTAELLFKQCLNYVKTLGGQGSVATILVNLALLEDSRKDSNKAVKYANHAYIISKHLGLLNEKKQALQIIKKYSVKT